MNGRLLVFAMIFGTLIAAACYGPADPVAAKAVKPNVILLTLDTTRADHIGCYGYKAAKTNALDQIANEGARFESAYSSVPNTLPSHAVILTGLYPFHTGIRDNLLYHLSDSAKTLATTLKQNGYSTLSFVSAAVLDRSFGLQKGFDLYDDQMPEFNGDTLYGERSAEDVNRAVIAQINRAKPPYFLWIHYYDPHFPYQAPASFAKTTTLAPYDAEIAFMDRSIGDLFQKLSARKLLDQTITVVVGDHGESLGEHGEITHGVFLYKSVMQVPMLLRYPNVVKAGAVVHGLSRTVDLAPTILDYAGIHGAPAMDGTSLRAAIDAGKTSIADIYEETFLPRNHYGWSPLFGIRTPQWNFIQAPRKELYDLTQDPNETKNIADASPDKLQSLTKSLNQFPFQPKDEKQQPVSDELKEQIASLGYTSNSGMDRGFDNIDPKDGIQLTDQMDRAYALAGQNKTAEAAAILLDVLKKNPHNIPARVQLGRTYVAQQSYALAQQQFETALKYSKLDSIHMDLALTLVAQGKYDAAAKQYEEALSMNARQLRAYVNWAELELRQKKAEDTDAILKRADAAGVRSVQLTLLRGRLAGFRRNFPEAIRYFRQALKEDPVDSTNTYFFLGNTYLEMGDAKQAAENFQEVLKRDPNNTTVQGILQELTAQ